MGRSERDAVERSGSDEPRVANNRLAVVVAAGSLLAAVAVTLLYLTGSLARLFPERLPEVTALPVYAIGVLCLIALVVWSWDRVVSFFRPR